MKRFVAVLVVLLLIFTFASCVDNKQTDTDGDVTLPKTESASETDPFADNGDINGIISTNSDREIEFPKDYFN